MKFIAFFLLVIGLILGAVAGVLIYFIALDHNPMQVYTDNPLDLYFVSYSYFALVSFPFTFVSLILHRMILFGKGRQASIDRIMYVTYYALLVSMALGGVAGVLHYSTLSASEGETVLDAVLRLYIVIHIWMGAVSYPVVLFCIILRAMNLLHAKENE